MCVCGSQFQQDHLEFVCLSICLHVYQSTCLFGGMDQNNLSHTCTRPITIQNVQRHNIQFTNIMLNKPDIGTMDCAQNVDADVGWRQISAGYCNYRHFEFDVSL